MPCYKCTAVHWGTEKGYPEYFLKVSSEEYPLHRTISIGMAVKSGQALEMLLIVKRPIDLLSKADY